MFGFGWKDSNNNSLQDHFFSKKSKSFGNEIRNIEMIKDISSQMIAVYENRIRSEISKASINNFIVSLSFSLSRMGVIFIREGESQGIDVSYNSYGYSAIEELEKINGVAWVLQSIICSHLLGNINTIKNISINASEQYGWTTVTLKMSIETNRYKVLC